LARHRRITAENRDEFRGKGLVVAPGSAAGTTWLRRFQPLSTAFASGWMRIRGNRRRRALDRGFVVSDHVDWPGLLRTIRETEAGFVGAMHGFTGPLARYLRETGLEAIEVEGFQERDDPAEES
jgi:putative mRNA 3-end processing factor